MAGVQRWYVEEPEEQRTQTPLAQTPLAAPVTAASPLTAGVGGFTDAQITAIAIEAGVTEAFVRQSLQESVQEPVTATAPSTAPTKQVTDADYWQVTLRVRKRQVRKTRSPERLRGRQVAAVVTLAALCGVTWGVVVNAPMTGPSTPFLDFLFYVAAPLLVLAVGGGTGRKRLGLLEGGVFGAAVLVGGAIAAQGHYHYPYGESPSVLNLLLGAWKVWLICTAVGAAAGLLGAVLRGLVPVAVRRVRRRRQRRGVIAA